MLFMFIFVNCFTLPSEHSLRAFLIARKVCIFNYATARNSLAFQKHCCSQKHVVVTFKPQASRARSAHPAVRMERMYKLIKVRCCYNVGHVVSITITRLSFVYPRLLNARRLTLAKRTRQKQFALETSEVFAGADTLFSTGFVSLKCFINKRVFA